jgi:hypothetical protein
MPPFHDLERRLLQLSIADTAQTQKGGSRSRRLLGLIMRDGLEEQLSG